MTLQVFVVGEKLTPGPLDVFLVTEDHQVVDLPPVRHQAKLSCDIGRWLFFRVRTPAVPQRIAKGAMGGGGDFGKGKGKGKKGKGKGKGKGKQEEKQWAPMTKLGRLVNDGKIQNLEEIYLHSLPIKEPEIIDHFYPPGSLKDEVLKIHPVQKMTSAGQTNRFVCYVLVGDTNGHIGLGSKCAKEVATAIRGGIIAAKLNLIPVRRGFWGNRIGLPHTVPMKVHGKCGSVRCRLIPAPRGSGIVGSPVMKKMMAFAGISDCFTCSCGHTRSARKGTRKDCNKDNDT
ncbi:unnamed protein product [Cladocopium goreaui]|uniref:Small ribosomal subunit protein uS5 n=1 Tax=Cladocopium goreaui TaxID=2562237 RepID=A0A9P1G4H6_9DINO|nr:unnamed protein product [Cladocopium goreaui]